MRWGLRKRSRAGERTLQRADVVAAAVTGGRNESESAACSPESMLSLSTGEGERFRSPQRTPVVASNAKNASSERGGYNCSHGALSP